MKRMLVQCSMVILLLLISQFIFAQNKTVSGTVTDKNGVPIAGVSVTAKGTTLGVTTNSTGNFSLSVPSNVNVLVLSSIGYGTQEVDISGKTSVTVSLTESISSLNELVVIGYGTARRKDLTGAVSTVQEKDFNKGNSNQYLSPQPNGGF